MIVNGWRINSKCNFMFYARRSIPAHVRISLAYRCSNMRSSVLTSTHSGLEEVVIIKREPDQTSSAIAARLMSIVCVYFGASFPQLLKAAGDSTGAWSREIHTC